MKPKDTAATNGTVKIDKNVPAPPRINAHSKYPWAAMEVGDSFFTTASQSGMSSLIAQQGSKRGWKFTMRGLTENGIKGYRVWRTE